MSGNRDSGKHPVDGLQKHEIWVGIDPDTGAVFVQAGYNCLGEMRWFVRKFLKNDIPGGHTVQFSAEGHTVQIVFTRTENGVVCLITCINSPIFTGDPGAHRDGFVAGCREYAAKSAKVTINAETGVPLTALQFEMDPILNHREVGFLQFDNCGEPMLTIKGASHNVMFCQLSTLNEHLSSSVSRRKSIVAINGSSPSFKLELIRERDEEATASLPLKRVLRALAVDGSPIVFDQGKGVILRVESFIIKYFMNEDGVTTANYSTREAVPELIITTENGDVVTATLL